MSKGNKGSQSSGGNSKNQNQNKSNTHNKQQHHKLQSNQSQTETGSKVHWCSACKAYSDDEKHKNERSWQCSQNPNSDKRDSKNKCDTCGKSGHITEQCLKNSTSKSKPRSYEKFEAEKYYSEVRAYKTAEDKCCVYCNACGHLARECTDARGILGYNQGLLRCRLCDTRGHMADDCRCPFARRCEKCTIPGHTAENCHTKIDSDVYSQFTNRLLLQQDLSGALASSGTVVSFGRIVNKRCVLGGKSINSENSRPAVSSPKRWSELSWLRSKTWRSPSSLPQESYSPTTHILSLHQRHKCQILRAVSHGRGWWNRDGSFSKPRTPLKQSFFSKAVSNGNVLAKGPTVNPRINRFLTQGMSPEDIIRLEEADFKVREEKLHEAAKLIRAKITASRDSSERFVGIEGRRPMGNLHRLRLRGEVFEQWVLVP